MARRKTANGVSPEPQQQPVPPLTIAKSDAQRQDTADVVKVNNASLTELKLACDDTLKRILGRPESFKTIHLHTDVRLALGWAGVFVACGVGIYGWKVEFEQSKPVVLIGLILYVVLTALQALYAYFIEGEIVFVGKRKTLLKRIETERITVSSRTLPSTPSTPPHYSLSVSYVRSSNSGKTLIHKGKERAHRSYTDFFDEEGTMDVAQFEGWVNGLVEKVQGDESK